MSSPVMSSHELCPEHYHPSGGHHGDLKYSCHPDDHVVWHQTLSCAPGYRPSVPNAVGSYTCTHRSQPRRCCQRNLRGRSFVETGPAHCSQ